MQALRRASLPRRVVAAVALLALLSACTKWKTTSGNTRQARGPQWLRVAGAEDRGRYPQGPRY